MSRYIGQRLIAMFLTLFIILTISFVVVRLMPGGPYDVGGGEGAEGGDIDNDLIMAINEKYRLNDPIIVQYGYYLKGIISGDFGTSMTMQPGVSVSSIVKSRIPITLKLNLMSLFFAIPIGLIFGIIAAIKKNTIIDHLISVMVVILISIPSFIFGALLQYFVAFKGGLFPIRYDSLAVSNIEIMRSLFLPMFALMLGPIARVARYIRAELGEVMNSEFLLLARTKGLTYSQSIIRHGIRNSFLPLINVIMPMFTRLIGGSLVIETIFSIPGMGGLLIQSVNANDYFVTNSVLLFFSIISLSIILIMDILYGVVDPRIRVGDKK